MTEYTTEELFERFDNDILSVEAVSEYIRENAAEIIKAAEEKRAKRVMTSLSYELGLACPSLVNHRVIGGHKKGRIIKKIPKEDSYTLIDYDSEGRPLCYNVINKFGTESKYFFFEFDGYTWAVSIYDDGKNFGQIVPHGCFYRWGYDECRRIAYYAKMDYVHIDRVSGSFSGRVMANIYEYPENDGEPIICRFYDYNRPSPTPEHLKKLLGDRLSTKLGDDTPKLSTDFLYEIYPDNSIKAYYRKDDGYVFSRELKPPSQKKSAKPKMNADSFERFSEWIENELEKDIPAEGGIYFDLFSSTDDGFGIYFQITDRFDPEDDDWGCDTVYSSDNMLMVYTSGEMEWQAVIASAARLIKKYLREGSKRNVLKKYKGIGTGLSDSDIEYIYINSRNRENNGKEK